LNKIKHFVHAYGEWIKHVLAPLGPWGMLAFAAVDGSFLGLPLDAIFVSYVYNDRSRFLLYVLLASAGSALGSICCASDFRRSALKRFTHLSSTMNSGR
jgi:membrane protein YqaA with SNARE-associated domain